MTAKTRTLPQPPATEADAVPLRAIRPVAVRAGRLLLVIPKAGRHPIHGLTTEVQVWQFASDLDAEIARQQVEQHGIRALGDTSPTEVP
jgi:hypothetical protein